jgi:hypothetical protein
MLSIATKVERIVLESAFLTEGLRRGLINLSELARQLQPQLESDLWKPVGQAAVVTALRRLAERLPAQSGKEIMLVQKTGELTTRTELTEYTFRHTDSIHECHRKLLAAAEPLRGAFVTVTRGVNEVMVICSRILAPLVDEAFGGERLLARLDDLNAVTLHLDPGASREPGVYQAILKQLAWDKIALVNMICTNTELTVLLQQDQTGPAFSALARFRRH